MSRLLLAAAFLSFSGFGLSATADTLRVERSVAHVPPNTADGVMRPVRGLDQNSVRAEFGDPLRIVGPVGAPPITRWEYDRFTVVFEHQYVLHSVVHRDQRPMQ